MKGVFSFAVVLDGDRHRLNRITQKYFESAEKNGIIDHHSSTQNTSYDFYWVDKDASSTSSLIYELIKVWGIAVDPILAELIYSGLIFDTGGFCYDNTTAKTFELASILIAQGIPHTKIYHEILHERSRVAVHLLGRVLTDIEYDCHQRLAFSYVTEKFQYTYQVQADDFDGVVEQILHTKGVEVSVLCIQREGDNHKLSLRSCASSEVDVSYIAQRLAQHGGGHTRAAGVRVNMPRDIIRQKIIRILRERYY